MKYIYSGFSLLLLAFTYISSSFALQPGSTQWSYRGKDEFVVTKADYRGKLEGKAVRWTSDFVVETFNDEKLKIPFLPQNVTLSELRIDGKPSSVLVDGGAFIALVHSMGVHKLSADFITNIAEDAQSPHVVLPLRAVPVSRVELTLPGKKEVFLQPASEVRYKFSTEGTVASAYLPMGNQINIRWAEGVPDEVAEFHASTTNYHFLSAFEGILSLKAVVEFEVSRGEATTIDIEIPKGIEIIKVSGQENLVSDWRVLQSNTDATNKLQIFFSKPLRTNSSIEILAERPLSKRNTEDQMTSPLLRVIGIQRQRGMIALLSNKEYALKPVEELDITRVGENALPASLREGLSMVIAHTFKYGDVSPRLTVQTTTPEKQAGKFDVSVYSLYSLHDLNLIGASTIELNVKSGSIEELEFTLPATVNLLSLTAPSLRIHKERVEGDHQVVKIEFTQAMEGQFSVDARYEQLLSEADAVTTAPRIIVLGAEVEVGQVAVEALSAVEVQAASVAGLALLDRGQLSQQILLKTSNPILMAYKYTKAENPYTLDLKLTRHTQVEVQAASIDSARYRTLIVPEGLMVTTVDYLVRNKHNQFLRIRLPEGTKVWSVSVDGNSERPAVAEQSEDSKSTEILVRIKNSVQGFPVKLTYETPASRLGSFGSVRGVLPFPDIPVIETQWDVFLPKDLRYGTPSSNMDIFGGAIVVSHDQVKSEMGATADASGVEMPLAFPIPDSGIKLSLKKLYYNKSQEDSYFSLTYTAAFYSIGSFLLSMFATIGILISLAHVAGKAPQVTRQLAIGSFAIGAFILVVLHGVWGISQSPIYFTIVACGIFGASQVLRGHFHRSSDSYNYSEKAS